MTKTWYKNYEPDVPKTIEPADRLLHQTLEDTTKRFPNHIAVRMVLKYLPLGIAIQSKMTYQELNERANRLAAAYHSLGLKQGDRVSIMLPNTPQQIIAFYGALKAGLTAVNTNPTYTARELQHQLHDSGAKAVVIMSGLVSRLNQIKGDTDVEHVIVTDVSDTLGFPFKGLVEKQLKEAGSMAEVGRGNGVHHFYDLIKANPATPPQITTGLDDVVLFQYTGGTTGVPKAAMLTHRSLVSNVKQLAAWMPDLVPGGEKSLGAIPFFHVYGMTVAMLFSIYSGAEVIVVPDPRNTEHVLEIIHREKPSQYPGVPAMYIGIINHPRVQEFDLRSVKVCLSGGAALPVEVAEKFGEITGGRLVEGYGLTETSPLACANPIYGLRKNGAIGLPVSSTDVEIVALEPAEDGSWPRVAPGEEGELCIHGPQVMAGYWNKPDETAKTIDADGWLHTGDIAKMDEDGYFYIVDRKKDLIIASGYNIVPREVEEVLFMHPKVQEAVVAGVPDPKRGETVKAFVVLKEGQSATVDEMRAFCKENLAPYKVPSLVEFRSELPKSQIGKVLRRVLVEEEKAKQAKAA
jgi:long-chain acyl-CoA synthetase